MTRRWNPLPRKAASTRPASLSVLLVNRNVS